MLLITIELLAPGSESLRHPIASMCIDNDAGLSDVSDYQVTAMESANPLAWHFSRFRRRVGLGPRSPATGLVAPSEGLRRDRPGRMVSYPGRRGRRTDLRTSQNWNLASAPGARFNLSQERTISLSGLRKLIVRREIELAEEGILATIRESETGGPVRQLITGREPHPTGRPLCIKAGHRSLPWESIKVEYPFMEIAEVASPVRYFMSQPHKLTMRVTGPELTLDFFPDFELVADARFVKALEQRTPFWLAAMQWRPDGSQFDGRHVVVEAKDDKDPRNKDPEYQHKLGLAKEVYDSINYSFFTIVRSRDLPNADAWSAGHEVWLDRKTAVTAIDVARVVNVLTATGGAAPYSKVAEAIGTGPAGRAAVAALHVRRVVSIDLTMDIKRDPIVRLLNDGGALL
jgi:hypothetical protein